MTFYQNDGHKAVGMLNSKCLRNKIFHTMKHELDCATQIVSCSPHSLIFKNHATLIENHLL